MMFAASRYISERDLFVPGATTLRDLLRGVPPQSMAGIEQARRSVCYAVWMLEDELRTFGGLKHLHVRKLADHSLWLYGTTGDEEPPLPRAS